MKHRLTNINLFEQLVEIEIEGKIYDLHNDYLLNKLVVENKKLKMYFQSNNNELIKFTFENVMIDNSNYNNEKGLVIDNFHRSRFLDEGRLLDLIDNKMIFTIEFLPDILIELRCESLYVEYTSIS